MGLEQDYIAGKELESSTTINIHFHVCRTTQNDIAIHVHCVLKKTPAYSFFRISMNDVKI